jgi:hypothetical protein
MLSNNLKSSSVRQLVSFKNLITNPAFENGTTGWSSQSGTFAVASNIAEFTASAKYGAIYQAITPVPDHIYYARLTVKADNGAVLRIALQERGGAYRSFLDLEYTGTGSYEVVSLLGTVASSFSSPVWFQVWDDRASSWTKFYSDNFSLVDLTNSFGHLNEPADKSVVDSMFTKLPSGFVDGYATLSK